MRNLTSAPPPLVMPAQAGTHGSGRRTVSLPWVPAFAGMTKKLSAAGMPSRNAFDRARILA